MGHLDRLQSVSRQISIELIAPNDSVQCLYLSCSNSFAINPHMHGWRGSKYQTHKILTDYLMPTLQKHITTKHSNIMKVVVMYIFFLLLSLSDGCSDVNVIPEEE